MGKCRCLGKWNRGWRSFWGGKQSLCKFSSLELHPKAPENTCAIVNLETIVCLWDVSRMRMAGKQTNTRQYPNSSAIHLLSSTFHLLRLPDSSQELPWWGFSCFSTQVKADGAERKFCIHWWYTFCIFAHQMMIHPSNHPPLPSLHLHSFTIELNTSFLPGTWVNAIGVGIEKVYYLNNAEEYCHSWAVTSQKRSPLKTFRHTSYFLCIDKISCVSLSLKRCLRIQNSCVQTDEAIQSGSYLTGISL